MIFFMLMSTTVVFDCMEVKTPTFLSHSAVSIKKLVSSFMSRGKRAMSLTHEEIPARLAVSRLFYMRHMGLAP